MQVVTDSVRQLLDSYAKVTLTVYIDGEKLDVDVGAGSYSGACAGDDEFSFGNACAASANITLAASRPDLKGHRVQIKWSVDGTEYPLISGQVSKAKVIAGRTEVEAWDDMYFAGGKAFAVTSAVVGTCTAAAAFTAVADAMGVSVETSALALLSDITISGGLSGLGSEVTNSAVAGYIAGLVGGNALMSRAGQLSIRQYAAVDWETEPYSGGASAENEDFSVTGITLQREITVSELNDDGSTVERLVTEEYSAGDGSLMIINPLSSQAAADKAFGALSSVTVRPGNYSFPGGLLLEPGDIFTVHSMDGSYAVAVGSIAMTFDGGVRSSVACGGSSDNAGGAKGSINQTLKALLADYAKFKKLIADNAEINSANILELIVGDIIADRIKAGVIRSKDGALEIDLDSGRFDILNTAGKVVFSIKPSNDGGYLWLRSSGGESLLESGTFVDGTAFFALGSAARSGAGMEYDPAEDEGAIYADTGSIYNPPTEPSHIVNKEYADALIDSLTASDVGAAPAGYGLGGSGISVSDLSAVTGCGFTVFDANTANTPFGYGMCLTLDRYGAQRTQIAFNPWMAGKGEIAVHHYYGTWRGWEYVNPPMVLGVEYRTTERWNGKVVYTKAVDLGTLPTANTQKTVTANIAATDIVDFRITLTKTNSGSVSVFPANDFYTGVAKLSAYFDKAYGMFYLYGLADMSGYTGKATIKYTTA